MGKGFDFKLDRHRVAFLLNRLDLLLLYPYVAQLARNFRLEHLYHLFLFFIDIKQHQLRPLITLAVEGQAVPKMHTAAHASHACVDDLWVLTCAPSMDK